MRIAIEAAGFTPGEANELRRAMATFRSPGAIERFFNRMIEGMIASGHERDFAERCFRQIEGFGTYGFPESHAASFAHLVYVSAWLKCYHPAEFAAALLNAQPMGFYQPAQIVRDAREHGIAVRAADVAASSWDCTVESGALRLGLRMIRGFRADWAARIDALRAEGRICLPALASLPTAALEALAEAGALRSLGMDRRTALWQAGLVEPPASFPLLSLAAPPRGTPDLPAMRPEDHVAADYRATGLSLRAHPMGLLRGHPRLEGMMTCQAVTAFAADGSIVDLAGIVTIRQRPGSARGTVFITIEDETGIANLIVRPALVESLRTQVIGASLLGARGRVQRSVEKDAAIVHVLVEALSDLSALLEVLDRPSAEAEPCGTVPQRKSLPRSRDFH